MRISASTIRSWMSCPLQAKFKTIEERPRKLNAKTSFGTCVHDALEFYNLTGDIDKAIERFKTTWENPELLKAKPDSWPKGTSFGQLKQKGIELLSLYHKKNIWDKRDIISAEHKFCVPFGDHELSGIVDLIEARKLSKKITELTIVDYKTAAKRPYGDDLRLDIQFTVYYYASLQPEFWIGYDDERYKGMPNGLELYEEFQDSPRKVVWYHLLDNKELDAGPRDEEDFGRLYRCVEEIAKAIDNDVYVPNISGSSCIWCDYTDICPVMIPPFDETPALIGKGYR
jgi:RecB family exonuclease